MLQFSLNIFLNEVENIVSEIFCFKNLYESLNLLIAVGFFHKIFFFEKTLT